MTIEFDKALAALKRSIGTITKNRKAHHYNYADLATIEEALVEPFGETWIFFDEVHYDRVVTRLVNLALGQEVQSVIGFDPQIDPQDTGKTITYFRRYNRVTLLNLETEDNDAQGTRRNEPAGNRAPRKSRRSRISETD